MQKRFSTDQEYLTFYSIDQTQLKHYKVEKIVEGNEKTVIHIFEPAMITNTVLLIHGYFDHTGGMKHIINDFLQRGWRVVSYDLCGHGLSTGPRAEVEDFEDYVYTFKKVINFCQKNSFYPHTVIAHSTGAAICTSYLLKARGKFEKVILLAPLVRPMNWSKIIVASKFIPVFTNKLERKFKKNSNDQDYLSFAKNDPLQCQYISVRWVLALIKWNKKVEALTASTQEIYIIQGTIDHTVDWKFNLPFLRKKFLKCQIAVIEGARHQLMNEHLPIRRTILKLIDKYLEQR